MSTRNASPASGIGSVGWSVSRVLSSQPKLREMAIRLERWSPSASRDLPGRRGGAPLQAEPAAVPTRSCSRRGLPCRPCRQGRGALLPHRFTLTSAAPRRCEGGLFSVALSLRLPSPGVTRRRISMEPGLSSPARKRTPEPARPSDHPTLLSWGAEIRGSRGGDESGGNLWTRGPRWRTRTPLRRRGGVVTQRIANPCTPVRFRPSPPFFRCH